MRWLKIRFGPFLRWSLIFVFIWCRCATTPLCYSIILDLLVLQQTSVLPFLHPFHDLLPFSSLFSQPLSPTFFILNLPPFALTFGNLISKRVHICSSPALPGKIRTCSCRGLNAAMTFKCASFFFSFFFQERFCLVLCATSLTFCLWLLYLSLPDYFHASVHPSINPSINRLRTETQVQLNCPVYGEHAVIAFCTVPPFPSFVFFKYKFQLLHLCYPPNSLLSSSIYPQQQSGVLEPFNGNNVVTHRA